MEINESEIEIDLSSTTNVLSVKEQKALLAYFKKHVPVKEVKNAFEEIKHVEKKEEKL